MRVCVYVSRVSEEPRKCFYPGTGVQFYIPSPVRDRNLPPAKFVLELRVGFAADILKPEILTSKSSRFNGRAYSKISVVHIEVLLRWECKIFY